MRQIAKLPDWPINPILTPQQYNYLIQMGLQAANFALQSRRAEQKIQCLRRFIDGNIL